LPASLDEAARNRKTSDFFGAQRLPTKRPFCGMGPATSSSRQFLDPHRARQEILQEKNSNNFRNSPKPAFPLHEHGKDAGSQKTRIKKQKERSRP
jgi:hypothetical protein